MAAPHSQNSIHVYISGWCEGTSHERCKGSYAGTICCCACHRQTVTKTHATMSPVTTTRN